MRVCGYMILLYGKEYLRESLLSVRDHVQQFTILYTPRGSQGYETSIPCPETGPELYAIAKEVLGNKLIWHEGMWSNEGAHRDAALQFASGFDVQVNVDADEVYNQEDLPRAIEEVFNGQARFYMVNGFVNLWKSFNWEVKDFFRPNRFINLRRGGNMQQEIMCRIYHFSCAQSSKTIEWKWNVSGHRHELRPDWFQKYYDWTPENRTQFLHPSSLQIWGDAFEFNPEGEFPEFMKNHPNWGRTLIE